MTDYTKVTPKRRSEDKGRATRIRTGPNTPVTAPRTSYTIRNVYHYPEMEEASPRHSTRPSPKTPRTPQHQSSRKTPATPSHPRRRGSIPREVPPRAPTPPSPPSGPPRSAWPPPMERPEGFRTPSPTDYTESESGAPESVKLSKNDLIKLLDWDPMPHTSFKTRLSGFGKVTHGAYTDIAESIHKAKARHTWHKAPRSSILVVETMEIEPADLEHHVIPTAIYGGNQFAINTIEHYEQNVRVPTACLYWCCGMYTAGDGDNGGLLVKELVAQIITNSLFRFADMNIKSSLSPGQQFSFKQLMAFLEAALKTLLRRAPVVVVVDSVHSYEVPGPANRNLRAVLATLAEIAERDGEKFPLKVAIVSALGFEPLEKGAKITNVVRVSKQVTLEAWESADTRAEKKADRRRG